MPSGKSNTEYLSKESTTAINGIFVFLVFLCHAIGYVKVDPEIDVQWTTMHSYMGQLVVVPFLFFSGYGIMCSIRKKGDPYVKGMFKKRFLSLLLHFDLAVFLYFLLNIIFLKKDYSLADTLLAFLTWTSIGNSNWYIGAMLFIVYNRHNFFPDFQKAQAPRSGNHDYSDLRNHTFDNQNRQALLLVQHHACFHLWHVIRIFKGKDRPGHHEKHIHICIGPFDGVRSICGSL